jgi:hypothetical protein
MLKKTECLKTQRNYTEEEIRPKHTRKRGKVKGGPADLEISMHSELITPLW